MKRLLFLIVTGIMILPACDSERATYEQCRTIFDHLVALELTEMGFEDPILTQQRAAGVCHIAIGKTLSHA